MAVTGRGAMQNIVLLLKPPKGQIYAHRLVALSQK